MLVEVGPVGEVDWRVRLLHQRGDDSARVQVAQIGVGLPAADEHDWLPGDVRHRYGRAHLPRGTARVAWSIKYGRVKQAGPWSE